MHKSDEFNHKFVFIFVLNKCERVRSVQSPLNCLTERYLIDENLTNV